MATAETGEPLGRKRLRLWPGVVIVALMLLIRFVVPLFASEALVVGVFAGLFGGLAVVLWWLFLSRAPWSERLAGVALMAGALFATSFLLDESIATGAQGMLFPIYSVPILTVAFVAWAVASRRLSDGLRRATMVVAILLACGGWALVRTDGVSGDFHWDFAWRWTKTAEERLLAQAGNVPAPLPSPPEGELPGAEWPGFRGPGRNAVIQGARVETDWSASPPAELWRRPIGPGWSSFAVQGDLLYTQEQRGEDEVVACYRASTGEPVWQHRDSSRFWEAMAGAGPRATPTLGNGHVYALGATGILNVLDALDGTVIWSRNAASDTGAKLPGWGFAGSPLVVDDVVIVALAGQLAAYDAATGDPRWIGEVGKESYSSPHLLTLDGVRQVVLLDGAGATSLAPADGTLLWEHPWPGFHSLQPALTGDGDVLITNSGDAGGVGTRRLAVTHGPGGWTVEERWTSRGLKPYFNDFVVHEGHAYGFDGRILSCIDLENGERRWKGGRYGHGQLVLLAGQDLLLVLSEKGQLALVGAAPDEYTELARLPAMEGKTWNHPVVVGDLLLVRNSQEMAAFRLPVASG